MNKYKKIILATAVIGLLVMAVFAFKVYRTFFSANTNFIEATYEVKIPSTATYKEAFLIVADAVEDRDAFHTTAVQKGYHKNVKPGRFILKKGMSNNDIVNTIRSKNMPLMLRFNNQERLENLAGRLAQQVELDSLSLLKVMTDSIFLQQHGFTRQNALSMYLPDSYEVYWNIKATQLREKMRLAYTNYWNTDRLQKARLLNLTPQEVTTLASIVHKETAKKDERTRVAGVYVNRLLKNIKLQADPTVIYAVKFESQDFNQVIKRVLFKDIDTDSRYNTYQYVGVPPGPLVTPDKDAIDAVLKYEKHQYFYFVADLERPGYHKFAKTLTQHNVNAAAYRKWVNSQGIKR